MLLEHRVSSKLRPGRQKSQQRRKRRATSLTGVTAISAGDEGDGNSDGWRIPNSTERTTTYQLQTTTTTSTWASVVKEKEKKWSSSFKAASIPSLLLCTASFWKRSRGYRCTHKSGIKASSHSFCLLKLLHNDSHNRNLSCPQQWH